MANEDLSAEEMMNDLIRHYSDMVTEWQLLFVQDMQDKLEENPNYLFTVNQVNKLREIYNERDEDM